MRAAIFLALSISLLIGAQAPVTAADMISALGAKSFATQSVVAGAKAPAHTSTNTSANPSTNASANAGSDSDDSTQDAYPRVTAIEQAILGQTFAYEPLPTRLERMERKAFNKVSDSDDLSGRTDALYDYADKVLHKNPFKAEYSSETAADQRLDGGSDDSSSGGTGASSDDGSSGGGSDYPHVTALEKTILGEAHTGDPLADRLSRMETKAFGKASTEMDLSDRTDALEKYAEKKLGMKPFGGEGRASMGDAGAGSGAGPGAGGSSRSARLGTLAAVGNTLLNMTGLGMMGMPGFGGMTPPQSAAPEQSLEAQKVEQQLEDPLLKSPTPPPASAKMLTKIGWCEIRVFGHTSAKMHMLDRLNQLNLKLNFDPGKTGLDLMDHIDGLMKLAESQKPADQSVGALPATAAQ